MKKKLLAILMATAMSMALTACGGSEEAATTTEETTTTEEAVVEETTGDYTDEQSAFVDEFNKMVDDYNVAVDAVNANEELLSNQELVDMMNEVTAAIDEASEIIADPANLTAEVMEGYKAAFAETYSLINSINEYLEDGATTEMSEEEAAIRAAFTTALCGADEVENTYWFLFNDDITFGAFVILSADYTQSINVVGEITSAEDGSLVITDETTSSYIAFNVVEEGEDYLTVAVEEGNEVTLINCDFDEAVEMVLAIDETTEIIE